MESGERPPHHHHPPVGMAGVVTTACSGSGLRPTYLHTDAVLVLHHIVVLGLCVVGNTYVHGCQACLCVLLSVSMSMWGIVKVCSKGSRCLSPSLSLFIFLSFTLTHTHALSLPFLSFVCRGEWTFLGKPHVFLPSQVFFLWTKQGQWFCMADYRVRAVGQTGGRTHCGSGIISHCVNTAHGISDNLVRDEWRYLITWDECRYPITCYEIPDGILNPDASWNVITGNNTKEDR